MKAAANRISIGALASAAGVNVETVRYYQRRGLLKEPDKPYGGIRRYGEADLARLRFIKTAQRLGFSLQGIAELLTLDDGVECDIARAQAESKLREVREKRAELARVETALTQLVRQCRSRTGEIRCPLIVSLQRGETGPAPG